MWVAYLFFPLTTPQYRTGNAGRWRKENSKETASEVFSEQPCPLGHKGLCTSKGLEFFTLEWSGGWLGWRGLAWWFSLGYRGNCWGCWPVYLKGGCGMNGCRDFKGQLFAVWDSSDCSWFSLLKTFSIIPPGADEMHNRCGSSGSWHTSSWLEMGRCDSPHYCMICLLFNGLIILKKSIL